MYKLWSYKKMQNNISIQRGLKEKINRYFLSNPYTTYRDAAKEIDCSISMITYYKDPIEARKQISARSGKIEWPKIFRFCFEKRKPYANNEERFTSLRKKGRTFIYACSGNKKGETYMNKKEKLIHKKINIRQCLNEIWPGIEVNEKISCQSVHPWTKELDYDDKGEPIMSPYTRSTLTGEIINAKSTKTEVDHKDGNRFNNHPTNFSFTERFANAMKSDLSYEQLYENCKLVIKNYERHGK